MGSVQSTGNLIGYQHQIYHFGKIKVLQTEGGKKKYYFIQSYDFMIESDQENQFRMHLEKRNNECPYLMQIKNVKVQKSGVCSNSSKIFVTFEYFPTTLQDLLEQGHSFTEQQVVNVLKCLLESVRYLNRNDSYHGDIYPKFIYVDFQNSKNAHSDAIYKIFDSTYFKPIRNGYYRAQHQKTYSAPEILLNIGEQKVFPLYNFNIADTFSIGLVALYCMTQVDPIGAYSQNNHNLDFYYLESIYRIAVRKGFSPELLRVVKDCLLQKNRPNASEILQKNLIFNESSTKIQKNNSKYSLKKLKYENNVFDLKNGQNLHYS